MVARDTVMCALILLLLDTFVPTLGASNFVLAAEEWEACKDRTNLAFA